MSLHASGLSVTLGRWRDTAAVRSRNIPISISDECGQGCSIVGYLKQQTEIKIVLVRTRSMSPYDSDYTSGGPTTSGQTVHRVTSPLQVLQRWCFTFTNLAYSSTCAKLAARRTHFPYVLQVMREGIAMDMLAGYGSGSESDEEREMIVPRATITVDHTAAHPQQHQHPHQEHQQQQAHAAAAADRTEPQVQLPSAEMLLGDGVNKGPETASAPLPGKRRFAAVTGHALPGSVSQPKANKEHSSARPGAATKHGNAMLMPPQLHGRSNVVTEDLDKLFTKRASPANKKQPQQ